MIYGQPAVFSALKITAKSQTSLKDFQTQKFLKELVLTAWIVDPNKATMLNLRSDIIPARVTAVLPAGTRVLKLQEHSKNEVWWQVRATLVGGEATGYLNAKFLKKLLNLGSSIPATMNGIPPCDLFPKGNLRSQDWGRAHPLDENAMPERNAIDPAQIIAIIRYLDPENFRHSRYLPKSSATFSSIYAHDFCARMGAFLPRVWWKENALAMIAKGAIPAILYANTVRELNANALHDWLETFGSGFGWRRVFSATDLQNSANTGAACLIVAKRKDESRSGHIAVVVPEHGQLFAARGGGSVLRPVMSQAGSRNYTAEVPSVRWWLQSCYKSFGFWIHA